MCKLNELLLPNTGYRGVIIRMNYGHIFYPYNVIRSSNGVLVPLKPASKKLALDEEREFQQFCQTVKKIIEQTSDPDPGIYAAEISGTKEVIRNRVLQLNKSYGLPGIIQARQQVAA